MAWSGACQATAGHATARPSARRATAGLVLAAALWLASPVALPAQDAAPSPQVSAPIVRSIAIGGSKEIAERAILDVAGLKTGEPLPDTPDNISRTIERQYRDEGYAFARATTKFDAESGALTVTIDEGVIDGVEFEGIDQRLIGRFRDEFALRAGDVFNRRRAQQALDVLLRPTRGAVRPGALYRPTFTDSGELRRQRGAFDLVEREGRRVLLVGLREPAGRFRLVPDLGEREDWFSSVDGFVPSFGMGIALFDHQRFNHAFVAGHVSYKTASERAGYSLGFERPLFDVRKLYVGGELHDLTASDDQWQVSSIEASLAALGPRRSFRDYYRRRGIQINSSLRVHRQIETVFAWKGEHHYALPTASEFSFWNDDEAFRSNAVARDGRLNALVVGASADSHGFERESLEASYRRHQLESPFGERLNAPDWGRDPRPVWRVDWTSEIASPDALGGDFDFRRHILTGRARVRISEHQNVGVRAIRGWSGGTLPPQRLFAAGGIGSVHGYEFKEQVGGALTLLNVEYELGWRGGLKAIGFFDAGRVGPTTGASPPWMKGIGFGFAVDAVRIDFGYRTDAVPSSLKVLLRFDRTF
jgi:outer membrane protein insertion porin family